MSFRAMYILYKRWNINSESINKYLGLLYSMIFRVYIPQNIVYSEYIISCSMTAFYYKFAQNYSKTIKLFLTVHI